MGRHHGEGAGGTGSPWLEFFLFPHVLSFSLAIISHFIWPYTPHMSLAQRTKKHSITLKLGLATCRPPPLPQLGQALSFPMPCSGPLPLTLPFSSFTLELEPSCLQGGGGAWPGTLTAGWQLEEIHLFSALRVAPWKGPRTRGKGAGKSCGGVGGVRESEGRAGTHTVDSLPLVRSSLGEVMCSGSWGI